MSQLATAIRAATHILETQLTVTSYKLYFGPHPIRVQRTTVSMLLFVAHVPLFYAHCVTIVRVLLHRECQIIINGNSVQYAVSTA